MAHFTGDGEARFRRTAEAHPEVAAQMVRDAVRQAEALRVRRDFEGAHRCLDIADLLQAVIDDVNTARAVRRAALARFVVLHGTTPARSSGGVRTRRAAPRLRERRERRHVARSTSSSDGPDGEPGEPPPPLGGFEKCPGCGGVLVWANGRLVCPRRSCPVAVVAG